MQEFKLLIPEGCKLHSHIKHGSAFAPSNKPLWFKHMDSVFSDTNVEIRLSLSAHKTSFLQENTDSDTNKEVNCENTIQT